MRRIAKLTKLKITYGVDLDDKRIPDQKMGNNKTGGFYQMTFHVRNISYSNT